MYKVVDVNDFVCLRHGNVYDDYVMVTTPKTPHIDRVGAFAIRQIPESCEMGKKLLGKKVGSTFSISGTNVKISGIYSEKDLLKETVTFFNNLGMNEAAQEYENKVKKLGKKKGH